MKHKFIEVRDRLTCIPVLCVEMVADDINTVTVDDIYLNHLGFSSNPRCILVILFHSHRCEYESWEWKDRTMATAHEYIEKNWDILRDGEVVDVEHIKGENIGMTVAEIYKT